jgi:hypothetical protein
MVYLQEPAAGIAVESPQARRHEMAEDLKRIARPAALQQKNPGVLRHQGFDFELSQF